jgi:hypothetical protein
MAQGVGRNFAYLWIIPWERKDTENHQRFLALNAIYCDGISRPRIPVYWHLSDQ